MIEIDLRIKHYFSDGLYAKHMILPKDHYAVSHKHAYSHLSILAQGIVAVTVDGITRNYHAPECINIAAGVEHEIVALEDAVWYCIHAADETDVTKIDEVLIKGE